MTYQSINNTFHDGSSQNLQVRFAFTTLVCDSHSVSNITIVFRTVEATDLTEEGTFISAFSLQEYFSYLDSDMPIAPSSLESSLDWIREFDSAKEPASQITWEKLTATTANIIIGPVGSKFDSIYR